MSEDVRVHILFQTVCKYLSRYPFAHCRCQEPLQRCPSLEEKLCRMERHPYSKLTSPFAARPAINLYTPSDYTLSPPYRFPMLALKTCLGDHGYLVDVSQMPFDWDGSAPVIFKFHAVPHEYAFIKIYMVFGCCFLELRYGDLSSNGTASRPPPHWAFVLFDEQDRDFTNIPPHVCSEDHIVTAWPHRSRTFSWRTDQTLDIQVKLTLSFRGDQHSPTTTLIPHVTHTVEGRPARRRHGLREFDPLTVNNDDWLRT